MNALPLALYWFCLVRMTVEMQLPEMRFVVFLAAIVTLFAVDASASEFDEATVATRESAVEFMRDGERACLGTIVRARGWVVTKASETDGRMKCRLADGTVNDVERKFIDSGLDIALFLVNRSDLKPVDLNAKIQLSVGQWFITPRGGSNEPVVVGILSRPAFAAPGEPGELGVQIRSTARGLVLTRVFSGSAAQKADLRIGDGLVRVAGRRVLNRDSLEQALAARQPGDRLTVEVLRDGIPIRRMTRLQRPVSRRFGGEELERPAAVGFSPRRTGFSQVLAHDTQLDPHDCGGPVVDIKGRVVGINIARANRTAAYALPASVVSEAVRRMLNEPSP